MQFFLQLFRIFTTSRSNFFLSYILIFILLCFRPFFCPFLTFSSLYHLPFHTCNLFYLSHSIVYIFFVSYSSVLFYFPLILFFFSHFILNILLFLSLSDLFLQLTLFTFLSSLKYFRFFLLFRPPFKFRKPISTKGSNCHNISCILFPTNSKSFKKIRSIHRISSINIQVQNLF